jgi:glycosyltransferase involved in cell wall biosynthesis
LKGQVIPAMTIEGKKHNPGTIRVLCVNLEGSISGAEQSLLLLVRFAPKSIGISAACPAGILTDRLKELGVKTYRVCSTPRKFNHPIIWLFYLIFVNLRLVLIVFKARPQIIHANSSKAVLAVVLAKAVTGKKLVWHARDLKCSRQLARFCNLFASKVIAVSMSVENVLISHGVKAELINVIYNGVAADEFPTGAKEKDQSSPITFANIGQFVPWKKQHLFIEAAERFLQDGSNAQFILIGDDIFGRDSRYKRWVIEIVKASSFASNIKIVSWQDDLNLYWPVIDCLIHTTDAEPFGRVIIEAMAHGVPVIAAADCGPAEIISCGKTGLLFSPDDIEELLRAMKTISQDKELAHNLAINAREHIVSNFQARKTAERIANVYEELMAA